jgi:uncharacterized protein (DUF305 family)
MRISPGEEGRMGITWRLAILSIIFLAPAMQEVQHDSDTHSGDKLPADPGWSELNSSMDKMHAAMASVEPSGDSDVDFVQLMLPHHEAAIEMARVQLKHGLDPQMRRLAQEIITDQQSEIQLMQLWMKQHQRNSPQEKPAAALRGTEER